MKASTLFRFLIFDRDAILTIARDRSAIWIGAIFVLSAGLARDSDREDLVHEPWRLLIPFGASIAASFILFAVVYGALVVRGTDRPTFPSGYRSFLSLFWMTAPLAWLYAIPYDGMLDPTTATYCHLWTLGLVAVWRVLLTIRIVSVLMGFHAAAATFVVMALADALALAAVSNVQLAIVSQMAGARMTDSELIVSGVAFLILILSILSAPVWGIGAIVSLAAQKPQWQVVGQVAPGAGARGPLVAALCGLASFCAVAFITQPAQLRRYHAEKLIGHARLSDAISYMSANERNDFPPHWDPPPRLSEFPEWQVVLDLVKFSVSQPAAPWVRAVFVDKLNRYLGVGRRLSLYPEDEELTALVALLRQIPEGPEIARGYLESIDRRIHSVEHLTPRQREIYEELKQIAGLPTTATDAPKE